MDLKTELANRCGADTGMSEFTATVRECSVRWKLVCEKPKKREAVCRF